MGLQLTKLAAQQALPFSTHMFNTLKFQICTTHLAFLYWLWETKQVSPAFVACMQLSMSYPQPQIEKLLVLYSPVNILHLY